MTFESGVDPALVGQLQARFAHFAAHECADDPLYVALAEAAAARPAWAALLAVAPPTQHSPTLWLAALQDRVLELATGGRRPPLADYYASAGAARPPDAALRTHLDDFIEGERAALCERIATRTNQTNEIGRCAVLWPVLQALVERTGRTRIALLDVGCSAGLNLGVDRWGYRYLDDASGQPLPGGRARATGAPAITCRVLAGARPASSAAPVIASRLGLDPNPIAVDDAAAVRWLRACLWPHDAARRARFDAAVAVARTQRWPVRATRDTTAAVGGWLASLPADVLPVVFNSWVLAYFDAESLRRHVECLQSWVAGRGAVWVSAEPPALARRWWPALPAPRPPAAGAGVGATELAGATVWTVAHPDGRGGVAWDLAARSHAHGRWLQWSAANA